MPLKFSLASFVLGVIVGPLVIVIGVLLATDGELPCFSSQQPAIHAAPLDPYE